MQIQAPAMPAISRRAKKNFIINPMLLLWSLFIFLTPILITESGKPQPANFVVALLFGFMVLDFRYHISPKNRTNALFFTLLLFYMVLVNLIVFTFNVGIDGIFYSFFYLHNLMLVWIVFYLYQKYQRLFLIYTTLAIAFTLAVQVLLAVFYFGINIGRSVMFFNNPNQLGYWALLVCSLYFIATNRLGFLGYLRLFVYMASMFMAVLSLSKAAMGGVVILLGIYYLRKPVYLIIAIPLMLLALGYAIESDSILVENVQKRLVTLGNQDDDSLAGRGYDRIWLNPQYLLFGAGEGYFHRFISFWHGELHSIWGTMLFCYGFVGFVLFLLLLIRIVTVGGWSYFIFLLPVFAYGITHQGLRTPLFWVCLAVTLLDGEANRGRQHREA